LRADEAMTLDDLSLLLRTSTPEEEIVRQVARRGFVNALNPAAAQSLAALGASPRLIAIVQDPQYILTAAERQQYAARTKGRPPSVNSQAQAEQRKRAAEFEERQRQLQPQ
jgi:hypothetical protein